MANQNDSFIDEVTDDLRRDRLFRAFRRFGWIAVLAIVALVGSAAWREYSRNRDEKAAQAWGDAVLAAQQAPDQVAALSGIDADGSTGRALITQMLAAGAEADAGLTQKAADRLETAAATVASDPILHDLALLKAVMLAGTSMDAAQRDSILSQLSKPGAPYELLALEQKAIALIGADRKDDAVVLIRQIQQKDGLSEPLRRRLGEMMITLGAAPEPQDGPGPQTMTVAPAN